MDIFSRLDRIWLEQHSKTNSVGCPFHKTYGGPVEGVFDRKSCVTYCSKFCGKLFPRFYLEGRCPCGHMNNEYVKAKFWEKFNESRG